MTRQQLKYIVWKYPFLRTVFKPYLLAKQSYNGRKRSREMSAVSYLKDILDNDPILKVDEFRGKFMMNINSSLFDRLVLEKKYEPELLEYCQKYFNPDRDVIDIGANIGFFSVYFAKSLNRGKVLAIEPAETALKFLYRNLELNNVRNKVDVFEGVISDLSGLSEIKTIQGNEEYSTIGKLIHPSAVDKQYSLQKAKSFTLDDIVDQRSIDPGFIKIDVEGAENLVFKGAGKVLAERRPVILCELSDYLLKENGSSAIEVIKMIKEYKYNIFDPEAPSLEVGWKDFGQIICFPTELNVDLRQR